MKYLTLVLIGLGLATYINYKLDESVTPMVTSFQTQVKSSSIHKVNDATILGTEFDKNAIAVIDAYATWCGACIAFHPTFVKASEEYGSKIYFGEADVDKPDSKNISRNFDIKFIPTLLVFRYGAYKGTIEANFDYKEFKKALDKLLSEK